jgi:DNA-binding IclR family transcriptional regulator
MTPTNDKLPPLERYFRIMEVLTGFPAGLSLGELAKLLALPRASTHRLLAAMQKSQLVATGGTSATYVLADRARRLVHRGAGAEFIAGLATPHLQQLVTETGETSYIARLEGTQVRTVVMESSDAPWRGFVLPGKIMYPHASASAKAILAFQPDQLVDQALSVDLPHLTRYTKVTHQEIKTELARVRRNGYASCVGEVDQGLGAIAVPIAVEGVGVIYALGLIGPLPRVTSLIYGDMVARMRTVAEAISASLSKTGAEIGAPVTSEQA